MIKRFADPQKKESTGNVARLLVQFLKCKWVNNKQILPLTGAKLR